MKWLKRRIHLMALWVAQVCMEPIEDPWTPDNVIRHPSWSSPLNRQPSKRSRDNRAAELRKRGCSYHQIASVMGMTETEAFSAVGRAMRRDRRRA